MKVFCTFPQLEFGYLSRFSLIANCLHDSAALPLIQAIQLRHIITIQLKAIYVGIAHNARRRVTLRQRNVSLLQTPAHKDLIWADAMLLADAKERLVLGLFVAHKRAVCFDDDVVILAVFDTLALLAPRVELWFISNSHASPRGRQTSI
jgi:hypothetical protein